MRSTKIDTARIADQLLMEAGAVGLAEALGGDVAALVAFAEFLCGPQANISAVRKRFIERLGLGRKQREMVSEAEMPAAAYVERPVDEADKDDGIIDAEWREVRQGPRRVGRPRPRLGSDPSRAALPPSNVKLLGYSGS